MITEYLRDGLFELAWFGLMTCVWLGWAQENPPKRARLWLGIGSGIGTLLALGGFLLFWLNRAKPTGLEGKYHWFGLLTLTEVLLAGLGCLILWKTGRSQWFALAVGLVVALHFVPLGLLLSDVGLIILGLVEVVLVLLAARYAKQHQLTPSFPIGVVMGGSLLLAAVVAGIATLTRLG